MEQRSPLKSWNIGLLLMLGALSVAVGCTKSSIRDLPFLRETENSNEVSFEADSSSNRVRLTVWHDSFESALQASRESGNPILADFTGSDWCTWCIKLKSDVFETSEFKEWARDNVVLLELDYPKRSMQSPRIKKQNQKLRDRYQVDSYPTVLFLDSDGSQIGKLGYKKSPAAWIDAAQRELSN